MNEEWRAVPGFEGLYEVSDFGRVRSLDRLDRLGRRRAGILLRPGVASNGYPTVSLCGRTHCVHALVLTAFVGPARGRVCRHLDGDRKNNALSNLAWGSPVENRHDADRHGTSVRGEGYCNAKLTDETARAIREAKGVLSQSRLAEIFGVSPAAVQAVHDGRTWKHV